MIELLTVTRFDALGSLIPILCDILLLHHGRRLLLIQIVQLLYDPSSLRDDLLIPIQLVLLYHHLLLLELLSLRFIHLLALLQGSLYDGIPHFGDGLLLVGKG